MAKRVTGGNGVVGPYRLESELGSGASGVVYRAVDAGGHVVAVKVLHAHLEDPGLRERFRREAEIGIDHPNVVKILGAGVADNDVPYIAFELLEGESLEARLKRGPLAPAEAVRIGRQVCAGLAAAHAKGVIHRDLKPANIVITKDNNVKVLDFGVALATARNTRVTQGEAIMGTPAYLSPEQARAARDLDWRTDIWALGAILYEAVSGKLAFGRDTMFATLVAIRKDDVPPLAEVAPGLPASLVRVIERALTKAREGRWQTVAEMDVALASVDTVLAPAKGKANDRVESRVLAVLLADEVVDQFNLKRAVETQGGTLRNLRGAMSVGLFGLDAWVGNEVARAVRAGLDARTAAKWMAVGSGQTTLIAGGIAGAAIEAAAVGIKACFEGLALDAESARELQSRLPVRFHDDGLAEVTARRLPTRLLDVPRVMGTSELVGREAELVELRRGLEAAARDGRAAAVCLIGPTGIGKTRLCQEAERLARTIDASFTLYSGRGELHQRDAALSLVRGVIKNQLRRFLSSSDQVFAELPMEERRQAVAELVQEIATPGMAVVACVDALCVLLGVEGVVSATLNAARRDPQLVLERLRAGILDYFAGALARGPVALILEELQWIDEPSLDVLQELYERHVDFPLFVLVTGREQSAERAATLFREAPPGDPATPPTWRGVRRIALSGLGAADVSRLVHQTLGRRLPDALLRQVTQHTAGNPLFVEQIVRALPEQVTTDASGNLPLPLSVRAAVQSRLDQLDPAERTVCQWAAIFDRGLYAQELEALGASDAAAQLMVLSTKGVMTSRGRPHPRHGRQFQFQNQLMAEVARGMLTDEARQELHQLVAANLATAAEASEEEVARHYELGAMPEPAARRYAVACLQAARAGDTATVLRCADRALALGVDDGRRFALHMARADALGFEARRNEQAIALMAAFEVAVGPSQRGRVLCDQAWWLVHKGQRTRALAVAQEAEAAAREAGDDEVLALALGCRIVVLAHSGEHAAAEETLFEAMALTASLGPEVRARAATWRAQLAAARGDLGERQAAVEDAIALFTEAGDVGRAAGAAVDLAEVHLRSGRYEEAEDELQVAINGCRQVGNRLMEGFAWAHLAYALALQERTSEALNALEEAERVVELVRDRRLAVVCRVYRGVVAVADDPVATAELCVAAADFAERNKEPSLRALALALASQAWLAAGDTQAAIAYARQAMAVRDEVGGVEEDAILYVALAESLEQDDPGEAEAVRREGLARIEEIASRIMDPTWREHFVGNVPAHRRLRR